MRTDPIEPRHGGDLAYATARYGAPANGWLDLSTGVNPHPYPVAPIETSALAALPDVAALDRLLAAARAAYRVPVNASLVATPGSEIALRLLPFLLPDAPVAIVGPTYGSHYEAWTTGRHSVAEIDSLDDVPNDIVNLVVGNPNNPDGRIVGADTLAQLASSLAGRGGALIVDEAFADLSPETSLIPFLGDIPAVVLRSFGKFFGLAGLRLGFVAESLPSAGGLARLLGDWPVSTAALIIGEAGLSDAGWQTATRNRLAADAGRLHSVLAKHGLDATGGTDLFILVEHANAQRIHIHLAEAGIWTRIFPNRSDWLRFGLPGKEADFLRLDHALAAAASLI